MERTPFSVVTDDGQELACDRAGEGAVCILVHGLGFRRKHWHRQVEALVAAGYTAVTIDLRGFGDSPLPKEEYTIERLARDLDAVREHLGVDRFHLIGHSMGGMVCLQYALGWPQHLRSLTLASTTAHNGTRACQFGRMMARLSRDGSGVALADPDFEAECRAMMDQVVQYVGVDDMMPVLAGLTADPDPARSLAWAALVGFSIRPRLAEISCPTFVMHGSTDPIMPYAAGFLIHLGLPGSRWLPFYEGGHNLPRENRKEFNTGMLDFLGSLNEEVAA
jgi:pimeloyl-ACP methyl ester carboxylesterase